MKNSLPVLLDGVRVASPCAEPWESMQAGAGGDRVRHCGRCDLDVFNLSSMTEAEAQAFVAGRLGAGRTCVRFFRRRDGTMLTQDCPVGWRRVKRRVAIASAAVVSFLGLGAIAAFAGTRTLTCHTSSTDPMGSPLLQSLVALFRGQPPPPQILPVAGQMIYVPPPSTPVPVPGTPSSTAGTTP